MKRLPIGQWRKFYQVSVERLGKQRILGDKLSWAVLVPTIVLNALAVLLLVVKLHPTEFAVPVHYSSLVGFDRLGPWYQNYSIAIFAVGVTIVNTILATASFRRSRITSFFLIIGSFVVALFALIISVAFSSTIG